MLDFVPQLLVLVGLGGAIVLLARKAKYAPEAGLQVSFAAWEKFRVFWYERVTKRFPREELERRLLNLAEKLLRRGRILMMKVDYLLLRGLEKVREARNGKVVGEDYWAGFAKQDIRFSIDDLVEAELRLGANPLFATSQEYERLAGAYLAENSLSDARRLLIEAWRRAPKTETVLELLESIGQKEA